MLADASTWCSEWSSRGTSLDIWISANGIVLVDSKDRYPLEAMLIPRKVTQVIPTHSVDIRLTDLFGKHRVMSSQKRV